MANQETVDILIVGSGMGGATFGGRPCADRSADSHPRARRAPARQRRKRATPAPSSSAAFSAPRRPGSTAPGEPFNPGNYYYVGGNSKLYGAVLIRYRAQDFEPVVYRDGATPGWPFSYDELEPWYCLAETLYNVRGAIGFDPTEPTHSAPYPFDPVPDEPAIAQSPRALEARRAASLSACRSASTSTDGCSARENAVGRLPRHPHWQDGRRDLRSRQSPCAIDNVELRDNARVERLLTAARRQTDRRREASIGRRTQSDLGRDRRPCRGRGELGRCCCCSSSESGVANRSGAVGRHFMNHNCSAVLAIDPRTVNDSIYQKTLGVNDFYLDDGRGGPPLGNVQLLGRVTAPILKSSIPRRRSGLSIS